MGGHRSRARRYAVLALYQWQLTGQDPVEIGCQFRDDATWMDEIVAAFGERAETPDTGGKQARTYDQELFRQLLYGIPACLEQVDARLQPVLDRPLARVDPVERAILRVGAYELLYSPAIPYRVIINEAVEVAKLLGAEQSHRYINGVLDRIARGVRDGEIAAAVER